MRTYTRVDNLSFETYNNLKKFLIDDVKGSTASSSSTQNVAFVSENTSSTNDYSTRAYSVFQYYSGQNAQYEQTPSTPYLQIKSRLPSIGS
ncbi:hypothetical protein Tco_0753476 [Tanacetum coccineum]